MTEPPAVPLSRAASAVTCESVCSTASGTTSAAHCARGSSPTADDGGPSTSGGALFAATCPVERVARPGAVRGRGAQRRTRCRSPKASMVAAIATVPGATSSETVFTYAAAASASFAAGWSRFHRACDAQRGLFGRREGPEGVALTVAIELDHRITVTPHLDKSKVRCAFGALQSQTLSCRRCDCLRSGHRTRIRRCERRHCLRRHRRRLCGRRRIITCASRAGGRGAAPVVPISPTIKRRKPSSTRLREIVSASCSCR